MDIEENITIKLTDDDVKEILMEHLKAKGYDTKKVYFKIEERGGDPMDRFPGNPTLVGIHIDAKKIKNIPTEKTPFCGRT